MQQNDPNFSIIWQLFESGEPIKAIQVMNVLKTDTLTLAKFFQEKLSSGEIIQIEPGVYQKRFDVKKYLSQDISKRDKKQYNPDFLGKYIPNETSFFTQEELEKLEELQAGREFHYDYRNNLDGIENFEYDAIACIADMGGSPYTRHDIKVFLRHEVNLCQSSQKEMEDILNYAKIYAYIRDTRLHTNKIVEDIEATASIMLKNVLGGLYRSQSISLGQTSYVPLDSDVKIRLQYEHIIEKLSKILNPFERAFFAFIMISYSMPFKSANLEISHIVSQMLLVQSKKIPFTFYGLPKESLDSAYIALYELCDIILLKNIFIENYIKNCEQYK